MDSTIFRYPTGPPEVSLVVQEIQDLVVWATASRGMHESSSPLYFFLPFTSSCTLNYNLAAIRRENQTKTRNLNKIRYLTTQIKDLVVDTTVIDYNIYRI